MSGSRSGEGKPPAASRSRSSALPRLYALERAGEDRFPPPFGNEHHMTLAVPLGLYLFNDVKTINAISIAQEITRSGVPGKCVDQLLCRPLCCRMGRHVEVENAAPSPIVPAE